MGVGRRVRLTGIRQEKEGKTYDVAHGIPITWIAAQISALRGEIAQTGTKDLTIQLFRYPKDAQVPAEPLGAPSVLRSFFVNFDVERPRE